MSSIASEPARKVWEYRVDPLGGGTVLYGSPSLKIVLDQLGQDGWELVQIEGLGMICKREKLG